MTRLAAVTALVLLALPVLVLLLSATAPAGRTVVDLAATVLPRQILDTLSLSLLATTLATFTGAATALTITRSEFPGRRVLEVALVLPLTVPAYLGAIVYRELGYGLSMPGLFQGPVGGAVVLALALYPYVYLLARASLLRRAVVLEETARSLGVGGATLLRRVVLRATRPALYLGGLLVFASSVGDFATAELLGVRTLAVAVREAWLSAMEPGLAVQLALLAAALPALALVAILLALRHHAPAAPGPRPLPVRRRLSGVTGLAAQALCAAPVLLGFGVPLLALLRWVQPALAATPAGVPAEIGYSLLLAFSAAALCVLMALTIAGLARHGAGRGFGRASLALGGLDLAMPAMVLALALLRLGAWLGSDDGGLLEETLFWLLLAMLLRFAVLAQVPISVAVDAVPTSLDEVARSAGRGPAHALRRIVLPMIRGGLMVGALLVFLAALKELPLSLVLHPFGYSSLAMSTYHLARVDAVQPAAVHALCMVLLALYPALSLPRWFDRS